MKPPSIGEVYQQELFKDAIRLNFRATGRKNPSSKTSLKPFEFLLNLTGLILGWLFFRLSGPKTANKFAFFVARFNSGGKKNLLSPGCIKNLEKAKKLLNGPLEPAALILTSHPATSSKESHLLGDIARHGVIVVESLFPSSKFTMVQAIDDFALDSLGWVTKSLYVGVILSNHLPINRIPGSESSLQKHLFKKAYFNRFILNLSMSFKEKKVVCVAFGGGVPHNARFLYTAREFAQRIYRLQTVPPKPKRWFEKKILSMLTGEETDICLTGRMSEIDRKNLSLFMKQAGMHEEEILRQLAEVEDEFTLETAYRQRFFNIVFGRICGKGRPLLLIPLTHSRKGKTFLKPCVLIKKFYPKRKTVVVSGWKREETERKSSDFIKDFVRSSFPDPTVTP